MKEQIYTIPVMDGLRSDSECPFCAMRKALEDKTIAYVLSPAYMEEDVRGETNRLGFCPIHLKTLYEQGNSLGMALMMTTFLQKQHQDLTGLMAQSASLRVPRRRFSRKTPAGAEAVPAFRDQYMKNCYVCSRVDTVFSRYLETFFSLWKKEKEVRQLLQEGKGFCIPHFLEVYELADQYLSSSEAAECKDFLWQKENESLSRMEDELEWFTEKFDYRHAGDPWKNSKDALPRSLLKAKGVDVISGKDRKN